VKTGGEWSASLKEPLGLGTKLTELSRIRSFITVSPPLILNTLDYYLIILN